MATTREQLQQWLDAPEGARLEFKTARQNYEFDKLMEYCVALANEGGGQMILGATDRRPRRIVGTAAFEEPGRTEGGLFDRLRHRVQVEELQLLEGRVLVIHVPSRLPGTAWDLDGRYLKREGDRLVGMSEGELRLIFAETGPDFSALPCPAATLAELSAPAIADFRERWARRVGDDRRIDWSDEETLVNAELLIAGQLTYAALILFGTRPALGRHLAQAEIVFEYRSSEASGPAADREEFREGFFLFHEALWQKINLRNDRQSYQDGLFRLEIPTFDEVTVREALLNAVAHRDYRLGGSVFVRQFSRRLEVVSPGGLPPGITPENILDQQNPRNRRLAEALAKCGLIERAGQGMNLMFERAVRQSKPLPRFDGTAAHEVRLTLDGQMTSPAFVRYLERLGAEKVQHFSTWDFLTLDAVHREQPLASPMRERLARLIEAGAVESVGRGKSQGFLLSRALYETIGQRGVHTRKKGLDHETKKALLEQHLRHQGEVGAPLSELRQVLPSESESGVQRLLKELRKEDRVTLQGTKRWARWLLARSKGQNLGEGVKDDA